MKNYKTQPPRETGVLATKTKNSGFEPGKSASNTANYMKIKDSAFGQRAISRVHPHPKTSVLRPKSAQNDADSRHKPSVRLPASTPTSASRPIPLPSGPESNSSARSNSPAPAIPHPSAAPPDTPTAPRCPSSSGPCSRRPDPSCSSRTQSRTRQPAAPRNPQIEETFFLSSTKTDVVINWSPYTLDMEDFCLTPLYLALSLQMRVQNVRETGASRCP